MTDRPHETVAVALIDAVAAGPVLDTGGVDRTAVECADALTSIAENLAMIRYRVDHPDTVLDEGARFNAKEEARRLLAVEGTAWLLEHGHFQAVGDQGLTLAKPFKLPSGETYVPGSDREEDLFRNLRRVIPKRMDLLRESITKFGDLREFFPVLEDTDGNVVDGRHRRAIDPLWPAAPRRVPREQRVAAATAANRTNAWTADDWKRLQAHAEFVVGRKHAAREIARLALLEDHERSNRVIGKLVGVGKGTVANVREQLEENGQVGHFRGQKGRPHADGTPAQPGEHGPDPDPPSDPGPKPAQPEPLKAKSGEGDQKHPQWRLDVRSKPGEGDEKHPQWRLDGFKRGDMRYLHDVLMVGAGPRGAYITDLDKAEELAEMILSTAQRLRTSSTDR